MQHASVSLRSGINVCGLGALSHWSDTVDLLTDGTEMGSKGCRIHELCLGRGTFDCLLAHFHGKQN